MKPLQEQTLYEILEVAENAAPGEIQKAYERARELYAPGSLATYTLMAPEEVAALGRRIEEARNVLLDPVARAGYDARLASGTPMPRSGRTSDSTPTVTAMVPPGFQVEAMPAPAAPPVAAAAPAPAETAPPPPPVEPTPAEPPVIAASPPASPPTPAVAPLAAAPAATPVPVVYSALAPAAAAVPPAGEGAESASLPAAAVAAPTPVAAAGGAGLRSPEKALVVPEGTPWGGELLRRAREARGLTVAQLADKTRITRHHIENVEAERFDKLPAPVYLRGIVMSIARELRLDGQKVARSYLERLAAAPRPQK